VIRRYFYVRSDHQRLQISGVHHNVRVRLGGEEFAVRQRELAQVVLHQVFEPVVRYARVSHVQRLQTRAGHVPEHVGETVGDLADVALVRLDQRFTNHPRQAQSLAKSETTVGRFHGHRVQTANYALHAHAEQRLRVSAHSGSVLGQAPAVFGPKQFRPTAFRLVRGGVHNGDTGQSLPGGGDGDALRSFGRRERRSRQFKPSRTRYRDTLNADTDGTVGYTNKSRKKRDPNRSVCAIIENAEANYFEISVCDEQRKYVKRDVERASLTVSVRPTDPLRRTLTTVHV